MKTKLGLYCFFFLQLHFSAFANYETEIKLMNDYKIKKQSPLKICKQAPYRHVRFHTIEGNAFENRPDEYTMKIGNTAKDAGTFNADEDTSNPPYATQAQDINGDSLIDILVSYGGCGSSADCMYDVLVYCGQGKYKSLFGEEGQSLNNPKLSAKKVKVDGIMWNQLTTISRYRNELVGCDAAMGDFPVDTHMQFDGKTYSRTPKEDKRIDKEFKKNFARIEKDCGKKFKF
jgi:hypothetical protein